MSTEKAMELKSRPVHICMRFEDVRGFQAGVALEAEAMTSMAISLKRLADVAEDIARHNILGAPR